jgi:hopene-associated glycosyltransferase HpnB
VTLKQMTISLAIALGALAIWLYLLLGRGGFWRAADRDDWATIEPAEWSAVTAVVPARDEAEVIGQSVASLLAQNYPGEFRVIIVDDQSRDGTAEVAKRTAATLGSDGRLTVLSGAPLPPGWTGKLWAMQQGAAYADDTKPEFLLLTDADIAYAPDTLRSLVAQAQAGGLALTSLMAKLRCESLAERALIPAFIFFFQLLYPFGWVNRRDHPLAGAAGGCMLVRRKALQAAGGIESIRGDLIDDCALGRRLKRVGPIWLALTDRVRSLRPYPRVGDIRRMVARTAYCQLRYSPLLLAGTAVGLALTYLAAPILTVFGAGAPQLIGGAVWAMMAVAFYPMLRFYRLSPLWGLVLPLIALAYLVFTLDSAYQHARGRGGLWKGRVQAKAPET